MTRKTIADFITRHLQDVMEVIIPDPTECRSAAEELREEHPGLTPEQLAERAVSTARKWAVTMGAATGVAANPITLLPAALADAVAMLRIEARMAGTVAALLDPPSLLDEEAFKRDVTMIVFPGAVSQALRRVGVRMGEQATKALIRRYASRAIMKEAGEHVAKLLGVRLTQKAVATKAIPLVGAGLGAAWNWVEIQSIGRRAIGYHTGANIAPPLTRRVTAWVRARRALPPTPTLPALPPPATANPQDHDPTVGDDVDEASAPRDVAAPEVDPESDNRPQPD